MAGTVALIFGVGKSRCRETRKRPDPMDPDELVQAVCLELPRLADGAPSSQWVMLFPIGDVTAVDGRKWKVHDKEHARQVVALSTSDGRPLPVDYDHDMPVAMQSNRSARAAGWIEQLEVRDDGIWGRIEWTKRAAASLADREYRYISPWFYHAKSDGELQRIVGAGLVNTPAIATLPALAGAKRKDSFMSDLLKQLLELLGQPKDATAEQAIAAVKSALAAGTSVTAIASSLGLPATAAAKDIETAIAAAKAGREKIAGALGLAATATVDEIVTAIAAVKTADVSKLQADILKLNAQLVELQAKGSKDESTKLVDEAIAAGKIAPAARDAALAMAATDVTKFKDYVAKLPQVLKPGTDVPSTQPTKNAEGLTETEMAVCTQLGIAPADFKKTRDAEVK